MALTIGNALSPRVHSSGGASRRSAAALQAQMAQYQKQLSDCVNCASSSTSQGRAQIQALNSKIEALRSQIGDLGSAAQASEQPKQTRQLAPANGADNGAGLYGAAGSLDGVQAGSGQAQTGTGRVLDVYA